MIDFANILGENELKLIYDKGSDGGKGDSSGKHDDDHNRFNEDVNVVEWDMKSNEW